MKLTVTVPAGWALQLKNAVEEAFDILRSPKAQIYDAVADLPKPTVFWNGRTVLVRDIDGMGAKGSATCLDGAWYDSSWSAL